MTRRIIAGNATGKAMATAVLLALSSSAIIKASEPAPDSIVLSYSVDDRFAVSRATSNFTRKLHDKLEALRIVDKVTIVQVFEDSHATVFISFDDDAARRVQKFTTPILSFVDAVLPEDARVKAERQRFGLVKCLIAPGDSGVFLSKAEEDEILKRVDARLQQRKGLVAALQVGGSAPDRWSLDVVLPPDAGASDVAHAERIAWPRGELAVGLCLSLADVKDADRLFNLLLQRHPGEDYVFRWVRCLKNLAAERSLAARPVEGDEQVVEVLFLQRGRPTLSGWQGKDGYDTDAKPFLDFDLQEGDIEEMQQLSTEFKARRVVTTGCTVGVVLDTVVIGASSVEEMVESQSVRGAQHLPPEEMHAIIDIVEGGVLPVTLRRNPQATRTPERPANGFLPSSATIACGRPVSRGGRSGGVKHSPTKQAYGVTDIAFSADGWRLAAAFADESVQVWDAVAQLELASIPRCGTRVQVDSTGTRLLAAGEKPIIKSVDLRTGATTSFIANHQGLVTAGAIAQDGTCAVLGWADGEVRMVTPAAKAESVRFDGHHAWVGSVAVSMPGCCLSGAALDHSIRLWDRRTGRQRCMLKGHAGAVRSMAFNRKGDRLVTASGDKTARVWDSLTGQELFVLKGHGHGVCKALFSASGEWIATVAEDGGVGIWEVATGNKRIVATGGEGAGSPLAFSPDNTRLATGGDAHRRGAAVWSVESGRKLCDVGEGKATVAAFHPDGSSLAIGYDDGRVEIHGQKSQDIHSARRELRSAEERLGATLACWMEAGAEAAANRLENEKSLIPASDYRFAAGFILSRAASRSGDEPLAEEL